MAATTLAMRDFERVAKLGEGTFGVVYKALQRNTGLYFAIKKIKLEDEENGIPATSLREIAVLRELQHPNIVQLRSVLYIDTENLHLVFEYLDYDLKRYMEHAGPVGMSPEIVSSYMQQLLKGIDYCHARRIVHRDLKPQNLLIDRQGKLKIADFGLARCFGVPLRPYTHEIVTLWYRAPEILLGGQKYGIGVDMWSIGCIFAEMVRCSAFFTGDCEIDQLFKIFETMGTPNEKVWPGLSELPDWKAHFPQWKKIDLSQRVKRLGSVGLDLLEKLLTYNPGTRISAKTALRHPYFD